MDETDSKLLAALRRDARQPLSELAAQLGVSRATVRARMGRLVERGEITGFTATTRADHARAPVRGLMMLGIEGAGADRIARRLLGIVEVERIHSTNGKWDLIVDLGTDTLEALDRTLSAIRALPGVTRSETNLLLSTRRPVRR